MNKRIYISADYSEERGDRDVVNALNNLGKDDFHIVNFVDMSQVISGSISKNNPDCRSCDLKKEFNSQINASSAVVFIVGDRTRYRTAGSNCSKAKPNQFIYTCTPYKQNTNGIKSCKNYASAYSLNNYDINEINDYSYLKHEFEQAKKRNKPIVILYNSTRNETSWLPSYMSGYEDYAIPFWTIDSSGRRVVNYSKLKEVLGYA